MAGLELELLVVHLVVYATGYSMEFDLLKYPVKSLAGGCRVDTGVFVVNVEKEELLFARLGAELPLPLLRKAWLAWPALLLWLLSRDIALRCRVLRCRGAR